MKNLLFLAITATLASAPSWAGEPLGFEGASPVLDIEVKSSPAVPVGVALLQALGLAFRDNVLQTKFDEEFVNLANHIDSNIGDRALGYLLAVRLYMDEFGIPVVPGGQLISPIGIGREPVRALAEYYRNDQLTVTQPAGLRNSSSYVWIGKKGGKLVVSQMPPSTRDKFERDAAAEARRVSRLAVPIGSDGQRKVIQRSQFWTYVARREVSAIADKERRHEIQKLTESFTQKEREFNAAYGKFQETYQAYRDAQNDLKVLNDASTVLSLIDTGIKVGKLVSSANDQPAKGADGVGPSLQDSKKYLEQKQIELLNAARQATPKVNSLGQELESIEVLINTKYKNESIEVPTFQPLNDNDVKVIRP